jgi:cytochrome c oxidase subunit III
VTQVQTLDVSSLKPYAISSQSPVWWGQLLLAVIEGFMFSILMAAYLYTRLRVDVWPPPGDQFPHRTLPTISLLLLIASCLGCYIASEGAKRNSRSTMLGGMILNVVLAGIALALRIIEWHSFNFSWKTDIFGSYTWAFLALHSFDYVADLVFTLVLIVIVLMGRIGPRQRIAVHVDGVVWYFVVMIWIPLYVLIYWSPWILASQQ